MEQQQEQQQQQQHPEDPYRHHKRSREISAEEIQVQFLDQVEEFQLAQSIAVRSMVQQQIYEQQMMAHAGTTGLIDSAISSRSSSSSMLPTSSSSSAFDQQSYRTAGSSDSGTVSNQGQQQQQYYGQPLNNTRQFQGLPYAQQQQQQQQHHQQQQQQQQRLQQQKENSMQSQSNSGTGFPQSPSSSRTTPRPSTAPFYHSSPSELNQQNQQASNFYNPCDGYPSTAIRLQSQQQKLPQQQQSVQPSQQQQPESGQQTNLCTLATSGDDGRRVQNGSSRYCSAYLFFVQ
ncbi:hypothetical protein BGZ83_006123 [Gryganskiella cystojenkinii]|nr:hypothetical protein BGZ83_006123 [Gryganskiella cystojenkinii]